MSKGATTRRATCILRCARQAIRCDIVGAVRSAVQSLDKDLPLSDVATMDQLVAKSISQRRFNMMLLISFAVLAL